jgi:hypothetical protein
VEQRWWEGGPGVVGRATNSVTSHSDVDAQV